jgi:probable HAF family extracellular repeat protein
VPTIAITGQEVAMLDFGISTLASYAAASFLAIAVPCAAYGQAYNLTDLGTLPAGDVSAAYGINNSGQVVGYSVVGGTTIATLWSGGTAIALGMLPGANYSIALAINNSGPAVGDTEIAGAPGIATLWSSNGTATNLGALPGGTFSVAVAINNAGEVVGNSDYAGNTSEQGQATSWTDGTPTALGTLSGDQYSSAAGINATGEIVGGSNGNHVSHATVWNSGAIAELKPEFDFAEAINNIGQIVGDIGNEAVLWSGGTLTELETLPGAQGANPLAINNAGQIVGISDTSGGNEYATLWEGNNAIDLNDRVTSSGIGWMLEYAEGINDSGEIVGWGINPQGQTDAFLLTPCTRCQIAVVPESPTWSMMLLGFAGLGLTGYWASRKTAAA